MSEFYGEKGSEPLGNPADDPVMVVRIHPADDPMSPSARRVIRAGYATGVVPARPWVPVSGASRVNGYAHEDVKEWPVTYPIHYTTAFRHERAHESRRGNVNQTDDRGDMDVEAFKG